MRLPILTVLGTLLFIAVFGPFALMLAGFALTGDPDAAQVGLYLLVHVNPVAIPALLALLGIAWACQFRAAAPALPIPPEPVPQPAPAPAPRQAVRASRPVVAAPARRAADHRDVVIDVVDVVTVHPVVRPVPRFGPRLPAPAARYPAIAFESGRGPRPR